MRVERIPTLDDNYTYLIICEQTNQAAVVDAPEPEPVVTAVERTGVQLTHILSTHHHWDHSGANTELSERFDAPVYGHISDANRIPGFTNGLEEGDTLYVGELEAQILFIPAHTRGHIAYVFDGAVFCGDTLFTAGCGRLFEGDPAMMHAALNEKLVQLPNDTLVYCGHEYTESNLRFALSVEPGNSALQKKLAWVEERRATRAADWHDATESEMTIPSTLAEELETNPFMRTDSAEIMMSVREQTGETATDPITILRRIRELKDSF